MQFYNHIAICESTIKISFVDRSIRLNQAYRTKTGNRKKFSEVNFTKVKYKETSNAFLLLLNTLCNLSIVRKRLRRVYGGCLGCNER